MSYKARVLSGFVLALAATVTAVPRPDLASQAQAALAQTSGRIPLAGLHKPVEVIRDRWGVPHIYAETADDLFFAQGFVAAQDRLWQMEMWRRNGEGRLAEILGESALPRDIYARLIRYRGDMQAEWSSYAPDSRQIISAFVRGVNAGIALASASRDQLPVEFSLMGFRPEPWTPEVCLTRLAGYVMSGNVATEVWRAEMMKRLGPERTVDLLPPDPLTKIRPEPGLDLSAITWRVLDGHRAAGAALILGGEWPAQHSGLSGGEVSPADLGSNNWSVSGARTESGRPILANDPHRPLLLPSLRYTAHLVGPGWNVIGAGEPALPGVAVGHNERVAYGFTIFAADQQDLYVEQTHPADPRRYRYRGNWETMRTVKESFRIKGQAAPVEVELRFTRHGPVIHEDRQRHVAFTLRWAGSEPGGAGYLASLALSRARNWDEFLQALGHWKVPPQNVVYADVEGNIGYQAAGLAPVRARWNGLVPVPGHSGLYEWRGFRKLEELPRVFNPPGGFVATANHRTIASGPMPPVGYEWAPPYRFRRIEQVLSARHDFTIADMERLQHDETSLPAQQLLAMLKGAEPETPRLREALRLLADWDGVLSADSSAAALYEVWVQKLAPAVLQPLVPADLWPVYAPRTSLPIALGRLERGGATAGRQALLLAALQQADTELSQRLGSQMAQWRWGHLHQAEFRHPLASAFSLKPVPRGGDGLTVNNTNFTDATYLQASGASYRQIFDVGEWDNSVAVNVPGQSGQPGSPHYDDLLPLWAAGRYHPLPFSRQAVERHAASRLLLEPHPSGTHKREGGH